jgi:hypothetical protein
MTIVRGVRIMAAPCCGAQYAFPRYVSMNFSAFEYWTDGWREWSLMPNDEGLRRCECGQFVLIKDMISIESPTAPSEADDESNELPFMNHVPDDLLPECISMASSEDMEVAARLGYWRHLNHEYRERYRLHRDAEEAATKAAWESANPDRRTWWDKFLRRKPLDYRRPPNSPFTYPAFEPTDVQLQNMQRLSKVLFDRWETSRKGYVINLVDLYREQGRYDEAELVISSMDIKTDDVTGQLIRKLIKERQPAPMRYRM